MKKADINKYSQLNKHTNEKTVSYIYRAANQKDRQLETYSQLERQKFENKGNQIRFERQTISKKQSVKRYLDWQLN